MKIKAALSIPYANWMVRKLGKWKRNPIKSQIETFHGLIKKAKNTRFGMEHGFSKISTYEQFKKQVPIRDYEALSSYFLAVKEGEENVLWPGRPIYLCKTSGTTSGAKYIPLTKDSIVHHIDAARNAILCYIAETKNSDFVNGKMIFLQGSPELDYSGAIPTGRLSGIVAHHVPNYLQKNRMPSYKTNCLDDWEEKVAAITDETLSENMTLISGIPPWVQMYFDSILEKTGKETVKEVFPNFGLFIYGGVNFAPYRKRFEETIGKKIPSIELYPASEGFIAFQDVQDEEGMLLNLDSGIFYEFVEAETYFNDDPVRVMLNDVKVGVNYVIILSSNAGLWGYNIGDTVKFTSIKPYRIVVSGRIKHYTSAFGEHVIAEEVDACISEATKRLNVEVNEYHVAPQINPEDQEMAYHEWAVEFASELTSHKDFEILIDNKLQELNSYYKDLREGSMLDSVKLRVLKPGTFQLMMKNEGKLGGQNKVPRLSNDRNIISKLLICSD